MPRPAHHSADAIRSAALRLVAEGGPAAATIGVVARAVGAPNGSIYHRFPSRDVLIAEVWLEDAASCQRDVLAALDRGDGLGAALAVPRWVRAHPLEARVLLLHRREELVGREWPAPVRARAREVTAALDRGVAGFIRRIGRGAAVARRVRFALLDVPYAAVRRDVATGVSPPPDLDALIRSTWGAVMGGPAEGVAK